MIWSERRRFCFIHIPKTGGTSIVAAYSRSMLFSDVILGGTPLANQLNQIYGAKFDLQKHSGARAIINVVGEEHFSSFFSFAVIRDPVDRLLSFYRWLRGVKEPDRLTEAQRRIRQKDDFYEFAADAATFFAPQINFVIDQRGSIIVRKLLFFGDLSAGWSEIAGQFDLDPALPVANQSPAIPVQIPMRARDLIRQKYRDDFDLIDRIRSD